MPVSGVLSAKRSQIRSCDSYFIQKYSSTNNSWPSPSQTEKKRVQIFMIIPQQLMKSHVFHGFIRQLYDPDTNGETIDSEI